MEMFGLAYALHQSARKHHEAGRFNEAEHGYRQALAQDPRHFASLHMLGVLAGQTGHHDMALKFADQAIAVQDDVPQSHANRGYAMDALGCIDDAILSFEKAVALDPSYADAQTALARLKAAKKT